MKYKYEKRFDNYIIGLGIVLGSVIGGIVANITDGDVSSIATKGGIVGLLLGICIYSIIKKMKR